MTDTLIDLTKLQRYAARVKAVTDGLALRGSNWYYRDNRPASSAQTNLIIYSGTEVMINGSLYKTTEDTTLSVNSSASWDNSTYATAANRLGTDFYVYAVEPASGTVPSFILSANSTVPTGYTESNSRKIGGFHCLCAAVGSITWTHPITGATVAHTLSGYVVGDILPASVWDLLHRPKCDPEGYAYIDECDVWMSIYLLSWSGTKLVSVYRGTTADGASSPKWHGEKFEEAMRYQNGRLPWRSEFQIAAKGSNEQTNISGSSDKTYTGGWSDTSNRRMISNYGLEDCCGFLWQWLEDLGFAGGSGWTGSVYSSAVDPRSYGQTYGNLYRLLAGGPWPDGSYCGSRSANCYDVSACVHAYHGGRGASEPSRDYAVFGK